MLYTAVQCYLGAVATIYFMEEGTEYKEFSDLFWRRIIIYEGKSYKTKANQNTHIVYSDIYGSIQQQIDVVQMYSRLEEEREEPTTPS